MGAAHYQPEKNAAVAFTLKDQTVHLKIAN
jgi:hypothetical protein